MFEQLHLLGMLSYFLMLFGIVAVCVIVPFLHLVEWLATVFNQKDDHHENN